MQIPERLPSFMTMLFALCFALALVMFYLRVGAPL